MLPGVVMLDILRQRYYAQPFEVSIETQTLCNAACTFCPYPTLDRIGTKMADGIIFDLIEQMASWREPFFISPFKLSEPLLDIRMRGICERIEQFVPQASIRLFTNGQPLTDKHITWLSKLKHLDGLWISLNSCDMHEYGEMMKLSFDITARRLDHLHKLVETDAFPHDVTVSRVATSNNIQEADVKDEAFRVGVWNRWPRFKPFLIKRDAWLGYIEPSDPRVPHTPCARWYELNIMSTGKVALCCMDGKGEFSIGDVTQSKLLEIYNQPHLRNRRLRVNTRLGIDPCGRCSY